jgi:hypothetical protein
MNVEFPEKPSTPVVTESPAWESAPVTYDLDFHERLMVFLLYEVATRKSLILADQLNRRMGNSARRRLQAQLDADRTNEASDDGK